MKVNDKKLTPQLRFPEFKNSGEWEEKKLGDISTILKEKVGTNNYTLLSITAGYGLVSQLEKFGKEIAGSSYENYIVIHKNDFAYNKSATKEYQSGYVALLKTYDVAAVPNSIFLCFRIDETILNVFFLEQLFKFNFHDRYLRKLIQIGARAHGSLNISNKDFFNMPIPIPPLKEQQKIAEFLSSVDELIDNEKIKLENLREYKKGLLQNLFPKENQKVPDLRFPEFKNSGEWEEKQLGIVFDFKNGYTPSKDNSAYWDHGTIPWFRMEDIRLNGNILYDSIQHVTEIAVKGNKLFPANSIILSISATIGEFALIKHDFICNQRFTCLTLQDKCFDIMYCFYYMNIISDWCKYNANNNTFAAVSVEEVKKRYIIFPTLKEQQKIADFLSSVDELIIEQDNKIKLLHDYKKGLLQQLFLQGDLT